MSLGYRSKHNIEAESYFLGQEQLIENLRRSPAGHYVCLAIHPVYYGSRHSPLSGPQLSLNREKRIENQQIGWETYKPSELVSRSEYVDNNQEFQSFSFANNYGMLSDDYTAEEQLITDRVVYFGGANVTGASCSFPAQFQQLAAKWLKEKSDRDTLTYKFSAPGIGLARYFSWFLETREEVCATTIILGIGMGEPTNSLPEYWSAITGYNASHPPGGYLSASNADIVEYISRSPLGGLCKAKPQANKKYPTVADLFYPNFDGQRNWSVWIIKKYVFA